MNVTGLRKVTNKTYIMIVPLLILFGIMAEGLSLYPSAQQSLETHSPAVKTSDGMKVSIPNEILVTFRSNATTDQIHSMNEAQGMTILEMNQGLGIYRLRVSRSVKEAVAFAQSQPFVEDARPNYILAEVAGELITLLDMESVLHSIPDFFRHIYTRTEAKETLLRTLTDYKLFAKAARQENLDKIPQVDRKINAAIEKALTEAFLRRTLDDVSISEKDLRNYYKAHLREFQSPEQIKIRQIVVETEEAAGKILETLEAGAEFEKIAREKSLGATAQSGGELGWFGRGRLDPSLERAGFTLKKGEISDIIKTPSGSHLIKLEDKRSARQQSFSEVRNRIKQRLQERKQKEIKEQKRRELEQRYGVRIHSEFLSEIKVHITGETGQRDLIRVFQEMLERPH
jgi:peptidyl-prolyl cis-trans isomerase C